MCGSLVFSNPVTNNAYLKYFTYFQFLKSFLRVQRLRWVFDTRKFWIPLCLGSIPTSNQVTISTIILITLKLKHLTNKLSMHGQYKLHRYFSLRGNTYANYKQMQVPLELVLFLSKVDTWQHMPAELYHHQREIIVLFRENALRSFLL